jgi:hypothetical protein
MVRKSNKRRPRTRARKSKSRRTRKGGCGCGKSTLVGGSANLDVLPKEYYYSYNSEPNYLNDQMKGGKRKRSRGVSGLLGGSMGIIGAAYSFGPALDTQNADKLLGTNTNTTSDVTQQPASNVFPDTTISMV